MNLRDRAHRVVLALAVVALFGSACSSTDGQAEPVGASSSSDPALGGGVVLSSDQVGLLTKESNAWAEKMVDCLISAGWNAVTFEVSPGTLGFKLAESVPQEQSVAWESSIRTCQGTVGDPPPPPHFDEGQLGKLYDFYLEQRDCLIAQGYSMPEPPSRDTWIAGYYKDVPWSPYVDLPRTAIQNDLLRLDQECPQEPSPGVLD